MLRDMPKSSGKIQGSKRAITKSAPRTVRLPLEDEAWVLEQALLCADGFSGVVVRAVEFYRQHHDVKKKRLLETIV